MRIGLLTDGYRPGVNGIIRFISLHKRTLEAMGHEVFVFTWGSRGPDDEPGVIRSRGLPFVDPGYRIGLGYSREARSVLETLDVLHVNQPLPSGAMVLPYARRYDLPIVFTLHSRYDLLIVTRLPFVPLSFVRALLGRYLRWFAAQCDLVTASTPVAVQMMRDLGVTCPVEIVPCGVELARERGAEERPRRAALGLPGSAPLALYVGRLAPEKGLDFLLETLARPELARTCLLLVGDGAERERLEGRASELGLDGRVRFVGQVSPAGVMGYAALADLFVTPSEIEMLPIAVIEALAAGLPVVGPDVPWARSVVQHGVNGLLARREAAPFAQVCAALLDDEALRARLAAGARETSRQYDIRRVSATLAAHYERLVEERRG